MVKEIHAMNSSPYPGPKHSAHPYPHTLIGSRPFPRRAVEMAGVGMWIGRGKDQTSNPNQKVNTYKISFPMKYMKDSRSKIWAYYKLKDSNWNSDSHGKLALKGHTTEEGYKEGFEDIKELFKKHEIEVKYERRSAIRPKQFLTMNGEPLLTFIHEEVGRNSFAVEIFDSKEYPESKKILKDFFNNILFTDSESKVYLKASNESEIDVIKAKKKKDIRLEMSSLESQTDPPLILFFASLLVAFWGAFFLVYYPFESMEFITKLGMVAISILMIIVGLGLPIALYRNKKLSEKELKILREVYRKL
jgi:predicted permease